MTWQACTDVPDAPPRRRKCRPLCEPEAVTIDGGPVAVLLADGATEAAVKPGVKPYPFGMWSAHPCGERGQTATCFSCRRGGNFPPSAAKAPELRWTSVQTIVPWSRSPRTALKWLSVSYSSTILWLSVPYLCCVI
jgi:hypothetical protein